MGPGGVWYTDEKEEVRRAMLKWFGQKMDWGPIEASVLIQAFYYLTVGLEEWRRGRMGL